MNDATIMITLAILLVGIGAYIKVLLNNKRRNLMFEKKQPTCNSSIYGPYTAGGKGASKS